jgi:hypothetical protein
VIFLLKKKMSAGYQRLRDTSFWNALVQRSHGVVVALDEEHVRWHGEFDKMLETLHRDPRTYHLVFLVHNAWWEDVRWFTMKWQSHGFVLSETTANTDWAFSLPTSFRQFAGQHEWPSHQQMFREAPGTVLWIQPLMFLYVEPGRAKMTTSTRQFLSIATMQAWTLRDAIVQKQKRVYVLENNKPQTIKIKGVLLGSKTKKLLLGWEKIKEFFRRCVRA